MAWWPMDPETGGICVLAERKGRPLAADPTTDVRDKPYGGDVPCKIIGRALDDLMILQIRVRPRKAVSVEEKRAWLDDGATPLGLPESVVRQLYDSVWKEIDLSYRDSWKRPMLVEERAGICRFIFGRPDQKMDQGPAA